MCCRTGCPLTHTLARCSVPGGGGAGGRKGWGGGAERKRMREEIAVWAEIRLLHFLGRKWIRSGESCSLLLMPKNATRLALNPFSQTSARQQSCSEVPKRGNTWETWSPTFLFDSASNVSFCFASYSGPPLRFLMHC